LAAGGSSFFQSSEMNKTHIVVAGLWLAAQGLGHAWAQDLVKIEDAWARGTVAQQKASGAFMRLTPSQNARLVGVSTPVAGVAEVHEMAMEQGVMRMRAVPGLDLPAGKATELKPGGYHVMLMDLKQALQAGQKVPLTLVFENAARQRVTQTIEVPVQALGAPAPAAGGHGDAGHKH